ncbi:MAG TPA: TIGR01620 family protein, partial [Pseudomonadales bacterium]|nr:TIGR01620 family protein [Pseudomonadales bacterium]
DELQQRAQFLLGHHGVSEGVAFCTHLATLSGDTGRESFRQWRDSLSQTHNDREVLALYGQTVLAETDARALERVVVHAGDVTVMVALSRFPLIDMLFVLWRQLRLVEDVARAYGVDAGYWGRIRLLRVILRNMALAGAAEVAAEVGTQVMGAGVMAKLSTGAAQGIGAGILTARLGLRAMAACRVIPWSEAERPRLRQVSTGVLSNVRRYLGAGSDGVNGDDRVR